MLQFTHKLSKGGISNGKNSPPSLLPSCRAPLSILRLPPGGKNRGKEPFQCLPGAGLFLLSLTGSEEERFGSLVVRRENGNTLFLDDWSGQMRQYRNGVLFLLSVAEWKEDAGPDYRSYSIRTAEECDALAALFSEGKTDEIKEKGGRIWQTASGETFID